MSTTQPINPKAKLLEEFNIKVDSMATEYVEYDEDNDLILHHSADAWGETERLSVEKKDDVNHTEILSIECGDEEELIEQLAELFATVDYDKDLFETAVKTKYEHVNEI